MATTTTTTTKENKVLNKSSLFSPKEKKYFSLITFLQSNFYTN